MLWNVSNTKNYTTMTREEFESTQWGKGMQCKVFIKGETTIIGVRFDKKLVMVRLDKEPLNRREFPYILITLI